MDFLGGMVVKNPSANAGDRGSIPRLERSSIEGNGNPLQCSCLENSTNDGAWQAVVHGVKKTWIDRLSAQTHIVASCCMAQEAQLGAL